MCYVLMYTLVEGSQSHVFLKLLYQTPGRDFLFQGHPISYSPPTILKMKAITTAL